MVMVPEKRPLAGAVEPWAPSQMMSLPEPATTVAALTRAVASLKTMESAASVAVRAVPCCEMPRKAMFRENSPK